MNSLAKNKITERESGIELLKIVAIGLIVISHVVQTLRSVNSDVGYNDYILNCDVATTNMSILILAIMQYFGALGNNIFFVASAWFLLDSKSVSKRKISSMMLDIWIISVMILGMTFIIGGGGVSFKFIVFSLFPTTFANNWYLTCYLLFYPIHSVLNRIIASMTQRQLLKVATILGIMYIGFDFIKGDLFFPSSLILWVTIYFIIAYIKFYCKDAYSKANVNVAFLTIGIAGWIGIILITNFLGLRLTVFSDKLLRWWSNCNPFLIMIAISLFGLFRKMHFKNQIVNDISRCSLLIYIIHENILVRTYLRPYIWHLIYTRYGYEYVLLWVLVFSVCLFAIALLLSFLYEKTIQKMTAGFSENIVVWVERIYSEYEKLVLRVH